MFAREVRSQGRRSNLNIGPSVEQPKPLRLVVPTCLARPPFHALGTKAVNTLKYVASLPPAFVNLILPSWNVSRTGIYTAQCLRLRSHTRTTPGAFRNPARMPMRANKKANKKVRTSSQDTRHRNEGMKMTIAHGIYLMDRERVLREELRRLFPEFHPRHLQRILTSLWDDYKRRDALRESLLAKYKAKPKPKSPSPPAIPPPLIPHESTPRLEDHTGKRALESGLPAPEQLPAIEGPVPELAQDEDDAWENCIEFPPKRKYGPYKLGSYKRFIESQPSIGKLGRILRGPV